MGHLKRLRIFLGILKDKASLIKTTLSHQRRTSSIRRAVLRATAHGTSSPPSEKRIANILSFGHGTRARAAACIQSLMDRLHGTHNAFVALKCLFTIHNIIARGSFILKDQLSVYPSLGGRNFLNLSKFRDDSDPETWELSSWVRWYAVVLEQSLIVSRVLGYYISSPKRKPNDDKEEKVLALLSSDLLKELDALVSSLEVISDVPNSLHLQRKDLVYEIVRLVSEDYKLIQHEIFLRVNELGERITIGFNLDELTQFFSALKKIEDCKERLLLLFVNRKKNEHLWHLVSETKTKLALAIASKRVHEKTLEKICRRDESIELNRVSERFADFGRSFRLRSGDSWLGLDRFALTLSTVR